MAILGPGCVFGLHFRAGLLLQMGWLQRLVARTVSSVLCRALGLGCGSGPASSANMGQSQARSGARGVGYGI